MLVPARRAMSFRQFGVKKDHSSLIFLIFSFRRASSREHVHSTPNKNVSFVFKMNEHPESIGLPRGRSGFESSRRRFYLGRGAVGTGAQAHSRDISCRGATLVSLLGNRAPDHRGTVVEFSDSSISFRSVTRVGRCHSTELGGIASVTTDHPSCT